MTIAFTNLYGTFYFKKPGYNILPGGHPIYENLHRLDGPALIWSSGTKIWYRNGVIYRKDGPALESMDGFCKQWFEKGRLVRTELADGSKTYFKAKRSGAVVVHRLDGPAIILQNGKMEWWINGKRIAENEFNEYVRNKPI